MVPVPEAHQLDAGFLVLDALDEGGDVLASAPDPFEHLQHGLVGPAARRRDERVDPAGDRGEQVGVGRADEPEPKGWGTGWCWIPWLVTRRCQRPQQVGSRPLAAGTAGGTRLSRQRAGASRLA